jgi:hypothetical protein
VAAEGLGRIGGGDAVAAILSACPRASERAMEHAVIHALIEAGLPEPLLASLDAADARVRRTALVVLDQMPLRHPGITPHDRVREAALAACRDDDATLRDTGLWLVSGHPEWADAVAEGVVPLLDRIAAARSADPPRSSEADAIADRLARIAGAPAIAAALAAACDGRHGERADAPGLRRSALDVMDRARPKDVPAAWVDALAALVSTRPRPEPSGDARALVGPALRTLAGMSLTTPQRQSLTQTLFEIAADASRPPAVVTLALRAAGPAAELPDPVVARLVAMLGGDPDAVVQVCELVFEPTQTVPREGLGEAPGHAGDGPQMGVKIMLQCNRVPPKPIISLWWINYSTHGYLLNTIFVQAAATDPIGGVASPCLSDLSLRRDAMLWPVHRAAGG